MTRGAFCDMIENTGCVKRQIGTYESRRSYCEPVYVDFHEWVLIEEVRDIDPVYWRGTSEVLKRRWYCKFCRTVEEEKL